MCFNDNKFIFTQPNTTATMYSLTVTFLKCFYCRFFHSSGPWAKNSGQSVTGSKEDVNKKKTVQHTCTTWGKGRHIVLNNKKKSYLFDGTWASSPQSAVKA